MRATVLLIRHGHYDEIGRTLTGRSPGYALSTDGRAQAATLPKKIGVVDAVFASPVRRAVETAAPLALALGVSVDEAPEFAEVNTGDWTGRTFSSLDGDPAWVAFNERRGDSPIPGGESLPEVIARVDRGLARVSSAGGRVAVFTHADVIRAALVHALGMPLDHLLRLEIAPASVTTLEWGDYAPRVLGINHL